jgi:hypothetical protein
VFCSQLLVPFFNSIPMGAHFLRCALSSLDFVMPEHFVVSHPPLPFHNACCCCCCRHSLSSHTRQYTHTHPNTHTHAPTQTPAPRRTRRRREGGGGPPSRGVRAPRLRPTRHPSARRRRRWRRAVRMFVCVCMCVHAVCVYVCVRGSAHTHGGKWVGWYIIIILLDLCVPSRRRRGLDRGTTHPDARPQHTQTDQYISYSSPPYQHTTPTTPTIRRLIESLHLLFSLYLELRDRQPQPQQQQQPPPPKQQQQAAI